MQNKFTQKAQNSLKTALSEAGALGHMYIGSEHILLALLCEKDSIAAKVLLSRGLSAQAIRASLTELIGKGESCRPSPSDLTAHAKNIIENSSSIAEERCCTYIGTEHILTALLTEDGCTAVKMIKDAGVSPSVLLCDLSSHGSSIFSLPKKSAEKATEPKAQKRTNANLSLYSRDLTALAAQGKCDPVIGREHELERIIQILCRRKKNNPCLVGEPGVGKTAIVEGLAKKIADRDVPASLLDTKILSLDIPSMLAGAKYRGEFEDRMKSIMAEAESSPDIILFIDEMHVIVGAGAAEGAVDAANILKPALARGGIRMIGATTHSEYKKNIERDPALERRFGCVTVEEPSEELTVKLLEGLRLHYEAHHRLKISDDAIRAAVGLSVRYINDRFLPDKAIDLIDEAAARLSILSSCRIGEAAAADRCANCIAKGDKERETVLPDICLSQAYSKDSPVLGREHICEVISMWTGIPCEKILCSERSALSELEKKLCKRVIGQDAAISSVCSAIRRTSVGLGNRNRPTGVFMFLGKTGVGKTELALAVAQELFGSAKALIRFDMSEYSEKHSISKLIGSPPGYVGYGDGGLLTEKVRRRPYCVVLFDEIEKAHPDIFNLLLSVFEEGKLTDSQGRDVNFCNTVIIMTSNTGASEERRVTGFIGDENKEAQRKQAVLTALREQFNPEFLSRIDECIVFDELSEAALEKISSQMLSELTRRAESLGITLMAEEGVSKLIARISAKQNSGARDIRRTVTTLVEDKLANRVLSCLTKSGDTVFVRADGDDIILENKG